MALPGVGNSISFLKIKNEFGAASTFEGSSGLSFGRYRVQWSNTASGGSLTNLPLDTGIPQSGIVSFSNFHGKKLNVVVKFYDVDQNSQDIKEKFKQGGGIVTSVGGFQEDIPGENDIVGSKIIADINKNIGSRKSTPFQSINNNVCALVTGNWAANQELIIKIGSNGLVSGSGGNGGQGGGSGSYGGLVGEDGCSAIGITKSDTIVSIINDGQIRSGFGGGGGGGGNGRYVKSGKKSRTFVTSSGGGGGGGAGIPIGLGAAGGPAPRGGGGGDPAESFFIGGDAGLPGNSAGGGGHGGDNTAFGIGVGGRAPSGLPGGAAGGQGGLHGFTIVTVKATNPSYSGSGTLIPANRTRQNQNNISV